MAHQVTPVNYRDTRCPSGQHYAHPDLSCERIGDREWNPYTGYRTWEEVAAHPPQITGVLALAKPKES